MVKCLPGKGVTVITNGGSQHFGAEADLSIFPMKVYFNSDSMANILSLSDIANLEGARLTMDTEVERAIRLHLNSQIFIFRECADGLYYWDSSDKPKHSVSNYPSFAQTVRYNKLFYSKREIQGADYAMALQSALGWPSTSTPTHH